MKQCETSNVLDLGFVSQESLQRMCQDGTETSTPQASDALITWSERHPRTDGETLARHVGWGDRYPSIDYTAQELPIGNFQFLCVDMGFEPPLGVHLRTALGEPDKIERNQCVCAHLALGMEWVSQGRQRRIPNKSWVVILPAQIRSAEF